jgi:hypothetical protein
MVVTAMFDVCKNVVPNRIVRVELEAHFLAEGSNYRQAKVRLIDRF